MKRLFLLIMLFISITMANAQLVQVSGYIYERGDSSVSLPHATLFNKRTKTGTQSSRDGFYTILIAPGDTIEVSMISYKKQQFTLPKSFVGSSFHFNVYLKEDAIVGKGVTIYSITWEKFKEAFASVEVKEEKVWITMDNKLNDRSPVNANPHININGPISWLYNKLGKKAREQEKLEDLKMGRNPEMEYARRISNEYVMNITQLPDDHITPFLEYCSNDHSFYAYATDYDIKVRFLDCLPGYKLKAGLTSSGSTTEPAPSDTVKTPQ